MTEAELTMLRTYATGAKIWDAAALLPTVHRLADMGLTQTQDGRLYELTDAGRRVLAEND